MKNTNITPSRSEMFRNFRIKNEVHLKSDARPVMRSIYCYSHLRSLGTAALSAPLRRNKREFQALTVFSASLFTPGCNLKISCRTAGRDIEYQPRSRAFFTARAFGTTQFFPDIIAFSPLVRLVPGIFAKISGKKESGKEINFSYLSRKFLIR